MCLLLRKSLIRKIFNWLEKCWKKITTHDLVSHISFFTVIPPVTLLNRNDGVSSRYTQYLAQGHFSKTDAGCQGAQATTFQMKDALFNHFSARLLSDKAFGITQSFSCAMNDLWACAIQYPTLAFWLSQIKPRRVDSLSCIQGQTSELT